MQPRKVAERNVLDPSQLVNRHADALFGYAMLQLADHEQAEERIQETFLAALEAQRTYRGDSSERTWLMGILKHKICDHFRRRERESRMTATEAAGQPTAAVFSDRGDWKRKHVREWPDKVESPLARNEFLSALQQCLSKLPERMAEAFCLRELHGLEADRICKVLDISATNLWTLLHRARALLRDCLDRSWFNDRERGPKQ